IQLHLRRPLIGQRARTAADLQDGVRLLRTTADNAARAPVFETAGDDVNAVGQQRRGQRVAVKALQRLPVPAEINGPVAVDATTGWQTIAAHCASPVAGGSSPMRYTASIS